MFQHILLLTFRSFRRFKNSFFINLIGLSTGLTSVLLIYLWVFDELSMDKFHENDSRLYQVMINVQEDSTQIRTFETNSHLLAPALVKELPEIEYVTPVGWSTQGIVSVQEKQMRAKGRHAGEDYFHIFSFRLLEGNKQTVLTSKESIAISHELAHKLFGTTENLIGKAITWDQEPYEGTYLISGIFEKLPGNSSERFDFLLTNKLFLEKTTMDVSWHSNPVQVYLTLKKETDVKAFGAKLKRFYQSKLEPSGGNNSSGPIAHMFIRKYSDKYLYGTYENGIQAGGRINYVILFSIIGLFLLLIASINFMNLSTAKASRRAKEIGIKKAIGAGRNSLICQYLSESLILAFLASFLSVVFVFLLLPQFNFITGKELQLQLDPILISGAILITLITGLISGSYPALYLSGFRPVEVLKGKLPTSLGELWVRKGLVVFQFSLSTLFIMAIVVIFKQVDYVQSRNLGYNKDNVLSFEAEGTMNKNLESFLAQVKAIPGVVNTSHMNYSVGSPTGTGGMQWEGKTESIEFSNLEVGYGLIELLGIPLKEGRSFSRDYGTEDAKMILNEIAVQRMGLTDPVGKRVKLWGKEYEIVGVTQNFHFESLYEEVKPCFFRLNPSSKKLVVKIASGREKQTIERLEKLYKSYNPGIPFYFTFLDEEYQALYTAEQKVSTLFTCFAGIAIVISCLGLFGLAAFTAERRRKEIGIRKVLGASEAGIVSLLSREFIQMVSMAILIALPISYLIAKYWLEKFAFRIAVEWWFFAGAGGLALLIATVTVATQTFKAARINPVHTLRDE
ncbi:FtsX-like permease family protein [Rhodocytophaga rosea]|uniref:FtsX-like permease family protein n=2 Tax=Rhodocytophaga rosea TaxID=2704465 RepID=A0A6C0GW39_9BACT|nr:FtsX-like permease family protein [Rhodocytophaga rosea]